MAAGDPLSGVVVDESTALRRGRVTDIMTTRAAVDVGVFASLSALSPSEKPNALHGSRLPDSGRESAARHDGIERETDAYLFGLRWNQTMYHALR